MAAGTTAAGAELDLAAMERRQQAQQRQLEKLLQAEQLQAQQLQMLLQAQQNIPFPYP